MLNIVLLKRREFDEIVVFSAGFENSSVLWRTRIFKFRRKSKISQNYDFLIKAGFKRGKFVVQLLRESVAELLIEFLNAFGFFLPGFGIDVKKTFQGFFVHAATAAFFIVLKKIPLTKSGILFVI